MDSTGTKTYKRDGAYVTDPVLSDSVASYTPGISERRFSTTKFYHTDRLGTTERLTNTSQTTTDTCEYDAFGLLVSSSGSTPTLFGFAGAWGYQEDPDSGLKLLGHRYYDPSTGRFVTPDPIYAGRNWYSYVLNSPNGWIDPDGLQAAAVTAAGIAAAADGPLPIGDIIAIGILGWYLVGELIRPPMVAHRKGARDSTKDKHEEGERRTDVDQNKKEKGDKRRKDGSKKKNPPSQSPKDSPEYLKPGPKPKGKSIIMPGEYDVERKKWH